MRLQTLLPLLALGTGLCSQNESRNPPPGAPWTIDFAAAHRQAIAAGKPIFVYSTKTY